MPTVARSKVSIRIRGPMVDPERVSSLLGCAPDLGYTRGVMLPKRREPTRGGMWSIRAQSTSPGDLDLQIAALLARTTSDLEAWKHAGEGHRVDAFCGLLMEASNEGISISPTTLGALGQRGIELSLDVYGHPLGEDHADDV